ncbi:MAG: thioredoxin domain-containing protein [Hyphomonadaceae bacterium]|nr:thioredoxin domain-containing protein [Hyphomonadaceae bacterium]
MNQFPSRRAFAAGGVLVGLAAAGHSSAQTSNPDAMSIGSETAPVQLLEYASAACPHCAHFHATNWATLKANYIDTGHVRLTLSEMLTQPAAVAFGMFQLARCENADGPEYFRRLGILFERQSAIMSNETMGGVVASLVAAGAEWGLTEAQVMASLNDPAGRDRIMRSLDAARAAGVNATPTFFLNGQRLAGDFQTPEVMVRTLDAALSD